MSNNREKHLLETVDKYHFWMALLIIVILVVFYFGIGWMLPNDMLGQLLQDIIANLIPVILVFIILYAFFRHIQTLRSERETEELASKVADMVKSELGFQTRGRLIIHSAKYGAEDGYNDVTQNLNSAISAGRIKDLPITNEYLGPDPKPHVPKKLTVVYFYAGKKYSITKDGGGKLSLP